MCKDCAAASKDAVSSSSSSPSVQSFSDFCKVDPVNGGAFSYFIGEDAQLTL